MFTELGTEVVLGDLLDNDNLVEAIRGTDVVIHTAAQFRGGISEETARAVNLNASITLAKATLEADVKRFVFTSTGNVYRGLNLTRPCKEDDILLPATEIYPKTKIAAEEALLKMHREQGLDIRIMRLGFVYGARDPHIEEALPFMINWNPLKHFSIVHHEDVDLALLIAASTPGIGGRIYNVADGTPITIGKLAKLNGSPEQVPTKDEWLIPNLWDMTMDTERIKNDLNFKPKYPSFCTARDMGAL